MNINKSVTIIVPVYGHWDSLKDCVKSLKAHINSNHHKVMFVNDCGPDADRIEQKLKKSIKETDFLYFRNPKNLGFIGTCNRAVDELDKSVNDILLLNSDTKVTKGFLEEMLNVLYSEPGFGAVSPRSNNATIATIPLRSIKFGGVSAGASYRAYKSMRQKLPKFTEAPTAHGFCMLIRREVINRFGLFDTAFGKGYGEEVDLCQRIAKFGWKSAICNHAFVYHREAASFTKKVKKAMVVENDRIIRKRYPDFHKKVGLYLSENLEIEDKILPKSYAFSRLNLRNIYSKIK